MLTAIPRLQLALLLALLTACSSTAQRAPFPLQPLPYRVDVAALPFDPEPGSEAHWGTTARGAGYRIEMPDDWGGDLMVFLRGGGELCDANTGEGCVLEFFPDPLRPHLVSRGVAWATTTYSDYRLAPALRAQDAIDVIELFEERYPKVKRVFVWGRSFGGVATLTALELYPERFAGALPTCTGPPVEGLTAFYDVNLVALALAAPGIPELEAALAAFSLPVDLGDWATRIAPKIMATLSLGSPGPESPAASALREVVRRTSGGARPTFDTAYEQSVAPMLFGYLGIESPAAVGGRSFIDNTETSYRWETAEGAPLSAAEVDLNRRVPRFVCDPGVCFEPSPRLAAGPFGGFPRHTGRIEAPVMFLQNTGDLTAQFDGAQLYAELVHTQGRSDFLVQRAIRDTRHCSFHAAELAEAFDDLSRWLDTGVRPAGDDFGNSAEVANPAFGCRFTRGAHEPDASFDEVCR